MPLATYAELQAEVAAWLRRADLAAEIPTFIALAEAQMNRRLRVRPMAARVSLTVQSECFALPGDFLAERELKVFASGVPHPLAYLTPEAMDWRSPSVGPGRPGYYTLEGGSVRLQPVPDKAYPAELLYLQAIPALSATNPSNWVLAAHPDAYLYGALTQSAPYLRADERLQIWGTLFTQVLADIERADRAGAAARLRADAPLPRRAFDINRG